MINFGWRMLIVKAIALIDTKWGIAKDNKQIIYIPDDLKRFKLLTENSPVIMGRNTYESLPDKGLLSGRRNIILSRKMKVAPSVFELGSLHTCPNNAFVIGGESVYAQLLPLCDEVYLTVIEHDFNADKFFPILDTKNGEWEIVGMEYGPHMQFHHNGNIYRYTYMTYKRRGSIICYGK